MDPSRKIKTRLKKKVSARIFDLSELDKDLFISIQLEEFIEDSVVGPLFLHPGCMVEIRKWVEKSLETDPVPEVGGFLFGRFQIMEEEEKWQTSIEVFRPSVNIDFQSPNELSFGSEAMREVSEGIDAHPELSLVGWFHTHPGHTAYLSEIDLNRIQEGFFKEPYHVAIVVDSLTEEFDTGIFTRKSDRTMNNQADLPGFWKLKEWTSLS